MDAPLVLILVQVPQRCHSHFPRQPPVARTRAGLNDKGVFDLTGKALEDLKGLHVRGPLLVQLASNSNDIAPDKWLVPAPSDALLFPSESAAGVTTARIQQLVPLQLLEGAQTDFDREELMFIGQPRSSYDQRKPLENSPHFWFWETFLDWLLNPTAYSRKEIALSKIGLRRLLNEKRMHVSIDVDNEVARDGMLFQTSGLEFVWPGKDEHRLKDAQRLALAVAVEDHQDFKLRPGLTCFGGERRIITWRKSRAGLPSCPATLEQAIIANKACRVFLLTPACFEEDHTEKGYFPKWLCTEAAEGATAELKAIAIQRPQTVSGWDLDLKKPKPSRRLAPAGTVLFLTLKGSDDAIRKWISNTWMKCISNKPQDRTDGFGLAVLGIWSGQPVAMQKGQQS